MIALHAHLTSNHSITALGVLLAVARLNAGCLSQQEEGEGGAEDEMPPEVLAAKMSGVRAWLDATAALQQEQAGPTGEMCLVSYVEN